MSTVVNAQNIFSGIIYCSSDSAGLSGVQLYDYKNKKIISYTDANGLYSFASKKDSLDIIFSLDGYRYFTKNISFKNESILYMSELSFDLNEVVVEDQFTSFDIGKISDVIGTSIYAGKRTERILLSEKMAAKSSNNARQIYNKVSGINIFQNDDAGIQLNIGARGLNPTRSANFNTRQNGYDISADVLGYPESYYTPPAEALKEIQIVKGASSLQYGTQFGGLVNFVFKRPPVEKKVLFLTRNTIGSNSLYTNFSSISGTVRKLSYYSFLNYKRGNGFRPNSGFESINLFSNINYKISPNLNFSFELTYLDYLAQQAGGLTDDMFVEDPYQSNRSRNWFKVQWLLYNAKILYETNKDRMSISFFALDASRYALGFRDNSVDQEDPNQERDLIKGDFNNYGIEKRYLRRYNLLANKSVFLLGVKLYKSNNTSEQGPGSSSSDADFEYDYVQYPFYSNTSYYNYPNFNLSVFTENIFYINDKISITPGFRYEYINTECDGNYSYVKTNLANQPIFDTTYYDIRKSERSFMLSGLGFSYKAFKNHEIYSNLSQNYRSVTFSDISIKNPSFRINPDIKDESGYTFDIGFRTLETKLIRFDLNYFYLMYKDRIGFVTKVFEEYPGYFPVKTERGNVGDAEIKGLESLIDINIHDFLFSDLHLNTFFNIAYTDSRYIASLENGVVGNRVEFTPKYNLKTGFVIRLRDIGFNIQYSYVSKQFSDATNSEKGNFSGVIGSVPDYAIVDAGFKYFYKRYNLHFGVNNIEDVPYFTRRATGYPGPGIIPSPLRNYYLTLEFKI